MLTTLRFRRAALCVGIVVAIAACGSSKSAKPAATTTTKAEPSTTTTSGHSHDAGAHDSGGHHHDDSTVTYADITGETKREVDGVIKWASKYKTAADAKADGWMKATKSLYGIGAHWLRGGVTGFLGNDKEFDVTTPNVLLFDGEGDDAKLAGVSWILSGPTDPEGFTGSDDHWHRHDSVCFVMSEFLVISEGSAEGSPINLSAESCADQGGTMFPISNLTMMHLWIGDGYLDTGALFAHDHPLLYDGYKPHESV